MRTRSSRSPSATRSRRYAPSTAISPKMLMADGVAYLTRSSSSTIKMASEVSWTRVRKYASLPWRITSCPRVSSSQGVFRDGRLRITPTTIAAVPLTPIRPHVSTRRPGSK